MDITSRRSKEPLAKTLAVRKKPTGSSYAVPPRVMFQPLMTEKEANSSKPSAEVLRVAQRFAISKTNWLKREGRTKSMFVMIRERLSRLTTYPQSLKTHLQVTFLLPYPTGFKFCDFM